MEPSTDVTPTPATQEPIAERQTPLTLSGFTMELNAKTQKVLAESERRFRYTQNMAIQNLKILIHIGVSKIVGTGQYRREKKQIGRQQVSLVYWETKLLIDPDAPQSDYPPMEILNVHILNEELQKSWYEHHEYQSQKAEPQSSAVGDSVMDFVGNTLSYAQQQTLDPGNRQTVTLQHINKMTDFTEVRHRIEKSPDRYKIPKDSPSKELFENLLRRIQESFYFTQKHGDSFQDGVAGFLKPEIAYSIMQARQIHVPENVFRLVAEKRKKKVRDPETGKETEQEEIVWKAPSHLLEEDFRTFLNYLPREMPTQTEVFFNDSFIPLRIVFRRPDYDPKDPLSGFLIDLEFQPNEVFLDNISFDPHNFMPSHNEFEDYTEEYLENLRK